MDHPEGAGFKRDGRVDTGGRGRMEVPGHPAIRMAVPWRYVTGCAPEYAPGLSGPAAPRHSRQTRTTIHRRDTPAPRAAAASGPWTGNGGTAFNPAEDQGQQQSERLPADAGSIISRNAIPDTEVWYRQSRCLMWLRNIHAPKTACPGSACGVREIPSAPGAMSAL